MPISLAYSVDADDAFMFHALHASGVDTRGLEFTHRRGDTSELNALALAGEVDVVAISAGAYPAVAARYLLLPHGASVGRGFGPVLVARKPMALADLAGRRVGIPGLSTTAWLVLRQMQPGLLPVVVPIVPFGRIFDCLDAGTIDAALLIHEGRLIYESRGYARVAEIGEWWQADTGMPLPLGVNVIRRGLGAERIALVSAVLRDAIAYALDHRDEVIRVLAGEKRGEPALAQIALLERYLAMYANEDTRAMAPDARLAVGVLFDRAAKAGLLPAGCSIDWAP
ncbi:MAG: MqnA/MqnD/SBP family protein [Polyangia bacterium]|jgi:1,4-dihydroxy-6-naphthoate synthase